MIGMLIIGIYCVILAWVIYREIKLWRDALKCAKGKK